MSSNNNNEQSNLDQSREGGSKVAKNFRKVKEHQHRISSFIYESIIGLIYIVLVNVLNIIGIIIGSLYLHDCPASPGIPIVLIVNGGISVLICSIETFKRRIVLKRQFDPKAKKKLDLNLYALQFASFISLIVWIIMVIRMKPDIKDTESDNYCHRTVYLVAYWMLILPFMILATSFCCGCCVACCGLLPIHKHINLNNPNTSLTTESHVVQEV